jgi:hypothetical protein
MLLPPTHNSGVKVGNTADATPSHMGAVSVTQHINSTRMLTCCPTQHGTYEYTQELACYLTHM